MQEKEQVQTELSNLEKSFSEVLKRLDKYKEVIAGCRKVSTQHDLEEVGVFHFSKRPLIQKVVGTTILKPNPNLSKC